MSSDVASSLQIEVKWKSILLIIVAILYFCHRCEFGCGEFSPNRSEVKINIAHYSSNIIFEIKEILNTNMIIALKHLNDDYV